jgi:LysM repeat protein
LYLGQSIKVPLHAAIDADEKQDKPTSSRTSKSTKQDTVSYSVKSGDTLSKIASRYNLSNEELAKLNKISATSMVIVGQKLNVPDIDVADEAPEQPSSYVVQSGDTLTRVAAKFDMTPQQLAEINGLKANASLMRGASLSLVAETATQASGKSGSSKSASSKTTSSREKDKAVEADVEEISVIKGSGSDNSESYSVKRGESLNSIAAKYNLTAAELAKLNQISAKTKVQAGQSLNVPKLTVNYTIKRGDTLIRLASKHGMSVNELAKLNQISPSSNVKVGDVLVVPN